MYLVLRRLISTLLIACLAIPATAAPLIGAAGPDTAAAISPCHGEAPAKGQEPSQTAKHQCIGCVPLVTACTDVAAPSSLHGIVGIAAVIHWPDSLADLPAIPPPRS